MTRGFAWLVFLGAVWIPSILVAAPACDSIRREPCEGEACLAKYKAIQDCEAAVIADEQARRRRQLQRNRDYQNKLKKERESAKD